MESKQQPDPTIHIARLSLLLQQLKTIGRTDLHPPLNGTANSVGHHLRATHQQLSQFIRIFTSQPVQDALKQARDLEASDPTIVPLTPEEEDRVYPKRRKSVYRLIGSGAGVSALTIVSGGDYLRSRYQTGEEVVSDG